MGSIDKAIQGAASLFVMVYFFAIVIPELAKISGANMTLITLALFLLVFGSILKVVQEVFS